MIFNCGAAFGGFIRLQRMSTREFYDTFIKHLFRNGKEDLIPLAVRKIIPRSTYHRWKHEDDKKYKGCELNNLANSELELLREFVRSKNARRIFMAYVRVGQFT